jgi:tetratricopeptide (TPR) repeat protein
MTSRTSRAISLPRRLAAALVFVLAGYAIYQWSYLPYGCNLVKQSAERTLLQAERISGSPQGAVVARGNLEATLKALQQCPHDLDLLMIAAGAYRQLGRSAEAIPLYQAALTLDRRPEIYLNLGQAQAEAGRETDSVPNFGAAVIFDPKLITEVPSQLQQRVQEFAQLQTKSPAI